MHVEFQVVKVITDVKKVYYTIKVTTFLDSSPSRQWSLESRNMDKLCQRLYFLLHRYSPLEKVTITYSIQSLHEEKKQHSFHNFEMIPLDQVLLHFGTWSDELHDQSQEQDYYYRHKDQIVQKSMEYYHRHKRAINRKRKEGYECPVCYGHYTLNNRAAHYQTQKHLEATGKN